MASWLNMGSSGLGLHGILATPCIFRSWATCHLGYSSHLQVLLHGILGYTWPNMASWLNMGSSGLGLHGILATLGLHGILAMLRIFRSWASRHLGYSSHLQVFGYMASWLLLASSGLGLHVILATLRIFRSCYMASWATLGLTWHLG